jgi:phosphate transport system substrate-binding protein
MKVIKYVSENDGMIGYRLNWLSQPLPDMQKYVDNVVLYLLRDLGEWIL